MKKITEILETVSTDIELMDMLKQYINTNNKLLLLNIKDLYDMNDSEPQSYNFVYRGLAFDEELTDADKDDISLKELSLKYVATSDKLEVAKAYASSKAYGAIITYKITKDSVIFDTRNFEQELSKLTDRYEREIVIDVLKSKEQTIYFFAS